MLVLFEAKLGFAGSSLALTFASIPDGEGARAFLQRFARKRDLAGLGPVLAHAGTLEARLAETGKEVRRVESLRYRVFFEEGGAIPGPAARRELRNKTRASARILPHCRP